MATTKKSDDPQATVPKPSAGVEENARQLKKESIERARQRRAELLTKKASAALAKIQTSMNRINNQIAASPSPGALKILYQNYSALEGRAQAIATIMSNPRTRIEDHSLDDHPDHGHDEMHHHEEDVHVHEYGALRQEVHQVEHLARKLNQQEYLYNRREHPHNWLAAVEGQQQTPVEVYPVYQR